MMYLRRPALLDAVTTAIALIGPALGKYSVFLSPKRSQNSRLPWAAVQGATAVG